MLHRSLQEFKVFSAMRNCPCKFHTDRTEFRRAIMHGLNLLDCQKRSWSSPDPVDESDGHALIAGAARIRPSFDRKVHVFRPLAAFAQRFLDSGLEELRDVAQWLLRR
jgi:hypothetical protein